MTAPVWRRRDIYAGQRPHPPGIRFLQRRRGRPGRGKLNCNVFAGYAHEASTSARSITTRPIPTTSRTRTRADVRSTRPSAWAGKWTSSAAGTTSRRRTTGTRPTTAWPESWRRVQARQIHQAGSERAHLVAQGRRREQQLLRLSELFILDIILIN